MLVTGGGISETGDRWISALENYCLPVKALSKIFRAKFVEALRKSYKANKLRLPENLKEPFAFEDFIESSFKTEWVVYTKSLLQHQFTFSIILATTLTGWLSPITEL